MARPNALDHILPRADFVLVTAPLTRETEGLIGARVVDYGAILDVFDPEPLPAESPPWPTPNLIIVPLVSSDDTAVYMNRTLDVFFDNVTCLISNRPLRNRVVRSRQD